MDFLFSILAQYAPYSTDSYFYPGMPGGGMYGGTTFIGILLLLLAGLVGGIVQSRMQASMKEYSGEPAPLTGSEVARRMLADYGLDDVRVTHTPGSLTDHYSPLDRTVNLSDTVYNEATVAAMAVAAHECGHAVQHAQAYPWLSLRSSLVPMVNIGSRLGQLVLLLGIILIALGSSTTVAWIGLALFGTTALFALITLPVEFDASRRALAWMERCGFASRAMHGHASTALRWAAMTYVAAALSSIAMIVYYAFIILASQNRNRD